MPGHFHPRKAFSQFCAQSKLGEIERKTNDLLPKRRPAIRHRAAQMGELLGSRLDETLAGYLIMLLE
jgi:hypothetical protein